MNDWKRREFIRLSALGFAGLAMQLNSISAYAIKANGFNGRIEKDTPLNWDAFLEQLTKLAKSQHQELWNQQAYTESVKKLLLQCNFPEFQNVKEVFDNYENERENWFESETLHHEVDFQVSLFQFEKGEYIPHHDHPRMTGVINVVSGNLTAKNYDFIEDLTETREVSYENGYKATLRKCLIQEVENEILKGGDVSLLTADHGNIHSIMPNEFSQVIDVFTPAYSDDTNPKWYSVQETDDKENENKTMEAEYAISTIKEGE